MLLYHVFKSLQSCDGVWFLTGKQNKLRSYQLHDIVKKLGENVCSLLPAVHALTGCEATASFCNKGKRSVFSLLSQKISDFKHLEHFGNALTLEPNSTAFQCAVKFVCLLYQKNCVEFDVTKVRLYLFYKKKLSGENIPPILENLTFDFSWAAYQTYIWRNADKAILNLLEPFEPKAGKLMTKTSFNYVFPAKWKYVNKYL